MLKKNCAVKKNFTNNIFESKILSLSSILLSNKRSFIAVCTVKNFCCTLPLLTSLFIFVCMTSISASHLHPSTTETDHHTHYSGLSSRNHHHRHHYIPKFSTIHRRAEVEKTDTLSSKHKYIQFFFLLYHLIKLKRENLHKIHI